MAVGLPCSLGLIVLARPITALLYGGLSHAEISLAAKMVAAAGISVLFLSLVQTATAVLQAGGRLYAPVVFLLTATAVKTVASRLMLGDSAINIFGAPLGSVICYFVACLLDLVYIVVRQKVRLDVVGVFIKPLACGLAMTVFLMATRNLAARYLPDFVSVVLLVGVGAAIYCLAAALLGVFDKDEAGRVPVVGKYLGKMYREKNK